ncbi:unnamed protein product, partial [Adineta steineri]
GRFPFYNAFPEMAGVAAYGNVFSDEFNRMGVVLHNTNKDKYAKYGLDEYNLAPGQLLFHPGPNNTRACIRFTVPSADTYHIDAVFFTTAGPNIPGPSTDIHLSINNVELRSLWLKRNIGRFAFDNIYLNEGDYLQFEIGYGENKNYFHDGVQLNITITADTN